MTKKSPKKKSGLQTAARFSGVAIQMGATIYLGNLLGNWLDQKYEADIYESIFTLAAVFYFYVFSNKNKRCQLISKIVL